MGTEETRFQTFVTSVRPHRVAVLTKIGDPDWQDSCLEIIGFLTKLWGGSHCVIVPTDGKTISDEFWAVLSSCDPDILLMYRRTYADLLRSAPAEFERIVAAEVARHPEGADEMRGQIEDVIARSFSDEFTISDELKDEIIIRLAPFHIEKNALPGEERTLLIEGITHGSVPNYPLTQVLDVLDATAKPNQVAQIVRDVPDNSMPPELWIAAATGCVDSKYLSDLNSKGIAPRPVLASLSEEREMIGWGLQPQKSFRADFPLALSWRALNSVRSTAARPFTLPTIAVVGDTIREFCLYYSLLRLQGRALWLPRWFMPTQGEYPSRLTSAAGAAVEIGRREHSTNLALVTYSVESSSMQDLKSVLDKHLFGSSAFLYEIGVGLVRKHVEFPSRLVAEGNLGEFSTQMLVNNRLPGWLESPIPKLLNPPRPQSHRWIVDITFLNHLIPRHPALGRVAISGQNVGDVRSGREAVSYMCPGVAVLGNEMETNILRPSIRVPDPESIFRIALDDCGYECKISDKGGYELESVRKFGGLEEIGFALRGDRYRALLKKFLDRSESKKGVYDEGVLLKDNRRYLNFAAISKQLGSEDVARKRIDECIAKGILYRGYVFKCVRCSDAGWFSIAEIDQAFTCRRCGAKQQYTQESWKHPSEPSWFYKLDELIYLTLNYNGDVPLLTLDYLRRKSPQSFLYCPEQRIMPTGSEKHYLEMDICCISNGRLCIGEAKSGDGLGSRDLTAKQVVERYRDLALKLGATLVVFGTVEPKWSASSQEAIRTAFNPHPHISVLELTGSELYS